MGLIDDIKGMARGVGAKARALWPGEPAGNERGSRATPEASMDYLYRLLWVDPTQRQAILDIRDMDKRDGRVKRIHAQVARDVIKGGLVFSQITESATLRREWDDFARRLQLNRPEKLRSDARGLVMEGASCLQWVLDEGANVVAGVRMPSETIVPQVTTSGQFKDVRRAYVQFDPMRGQELAAFALYQLTMARFDPESFDDHGALGRPYLDASRETWKKLRMTEEDLVIRRRQRAPLRMSHVLEGATKDDITTYRAEVERDQTSITTDYYLNKKGGVTAVQGDANLDQIGDVVHLLDTFFSGAGVPKGLMGYTDDMARDILEDLKRNYYEEVDSLQDTLAWGYDQGFRLHLLLRGINPDAEDYWVSFAERRTETPNQLTDRMLKWQAMGMPQDMIDEEMGYNPQDVQLRRDRQAKRTNPYPEPAQIGAGGPVSPTVKVTPGNAPKGESATSTTHSNRLSEVLYVLYDPNQPRDPGGEDGGQWTSAASDAQVDEATKAIPPASFTPIPREGDYHGLKFEPIVGADPKDPFTIRPARYAKNKVIIHTPSADGWKTRAGRLADALSRGNWTNREKGYVMSPSAAEKFQRAMAGGWDASSITGELRPPEGFTGKLSDHWPEPPPADTALDAVKALGEIGLALAGRPDPAPPAPAAAPAQPITLHFHEAAVSPAPASAQPVTLTAQFNLPEAFGTAPAPVVKNEIIVQPAAVTVPPAVVKNEITLPEMSPSFEATINPEFVVRLPPRRTDTTINRDKHSGEMTGSTSIETDLKE